MKDYIERGRFLNEVLDVYVGHWLQQLFLYGAIVLVMTVLAAEAELSYGLSRSTILPFAILATVLLIVVLPICAVGLRRFWYLLLSRHAHRPQVSSIRKS